MGHTRRVAEQRSALVVGEALVDVVEAADGSVTERPGGSALNAAVALGRLGRGTRLATSYGDDPRGAALTDHLTASAVGLAGDPHVLPRTSVARARIREDGSASYDFDVEWRLGSLLPETTADARVLYVSSLGPVLDPGADAVVALVDRLAPMATVVYDLNIRPGITGTGPDVVAKVERMITRADLVKASDEDLDALWPAGTLDEEVEDGVGLAVEHLLELGPAAVVVTRGSAGAVWHTAPVVSAESMSGSFGWVPSPVADVVDTIGAGDTFGAGLVDALWDHLGRDGHAALGALRPAGWDAALAHAAACAAVTVSRKGADPPWRHEVA